MPRVLHETPCLKWQVPGFATAGGDCAESFSHFSANRIRDVFRVMLQMAVVMIYGGGVPVVKVGRLAGQFAKPRSANLEKVDGVELPSYRFANKDQLAAPLPALQAHSVSGGNCLILIGVLVLCGQLLFTCGNRGDIINGAEFTEQARVPDPHRLVKAYNQSAATLNLLRGFATGVLTHAACATPVQCMQELPVRHWSHQHTS